VKLLLLLVIARASAKASELHVHNLEVHPEAGFSIDLPNTPDTYLVLMCGIVPHLTDTPPDS
jgi:hypothetical protein